MSAMVVMHSFEAILYASPHSPSIRTLRNSLTTIIYNYSNTLDNSYEYTIKNDNDSFIKSKCIYTTFFQIF